MSGKKFDEFDRAPTVRAIEEQFGVTLSRVGSWQKFLVDESGTPYVIVGGYDDWHGISREMVAAVRDRGSEGKLVIAKRTRLGIRVYCGPLGTLLANEHKLATNAAGERQFNLGWTDGHPHIKEVRDLRLGLVTEISYSDEAKEKDRREKQVSKLLAALSPEHPDCVSAR